MTTNISKHSSNCPKCAICPCRCCVAKRMNNSPKEESIKQFDNNNERRCLLILVRHGTSQDEMDKRYSGWNDCELSIIGNEQMQPFFLYFQKQHP